MAGQFTVSYTLDGKDALNVGYITTVATEISEWQQIVDNIAANWAANIMPSLSNDLSMGDVELKDLDSPITVIGQPPANTVGGTNSTAESILSAVVISKIDSTSRRKGRWFIPGVPVSQVSAGGTIGPVWGLNLAAQFQVSQVNLLPIFQTQMANRHVTVPIPGATQEVFAPIESFSYSPTVGKQGRRRF